jgi:L-aspartate oxidase
MLECLVFGRRAAEDINKSLTGNTPPVASAIPPIPVRNQSGLDYKAIRQRIKDLMNDYGYVTRNGKGLAYALEQLECILRELESVCDNTNAYLETLNIASVACAILAAALKRTESIGSHYRED